MRKHQKNSPDFFDDYSSMPNEEESIPPEDPYTRPSKAWWESRDSGNDDALFGDFDTGEADFDLNDPLFDAQDESVPFADEGFSFDDAFVSGEETPSYDDAYAPENEAYAENEEPVYEEQPFDPYAPYGEEMTFPQGDPAEYAEAGELPYDEAEPVEDIPPMPSARRPITPESIPVRNRLPEDEEDEDDYRIIRQKPRKPFKTRLLRYLIVLAAVFVAALAVLWVLLGRYQNKKDTIAEAEALAQQKAEEEAAHALAVKRTPQLAFTAWYEAMTPDDWTDLWYKDHPEDVDGKDRVRAYMTELFSDPSAAAYKGLDSTEEAPVFVIKNSEQELVRATMSGTDVNWSVTNARLMLKGDKSASIRVALGTKVFCNGKELTEDYAGERESTFTYEPLKDFLVNPTSWVTYEVKGMLLEPELTFEAPAGCHITETADGNCFLCLDENLEDAKGYQKKATDFTKSYLFYYLSGLNGTYGNLYNTLAYVVPGSQAYTDLQDTYNGVVWNSAHTEIDTSNITTSGVVIWADNCYSVDVTYHATGNVQGQVDEYDATMRVYFTDSGDGFGLTHFETL